MTGVQTCALPIYCCPSLNRYHFNDSYGLNYPKLLLPNNTLPLQTLAFPGDYVYVDNNSRLQISTIDYGNNIIYLASSLASNLGITNINVTNLSNFTQAAYNQANTAGANTVYLTGIETTQNTNIGLAWNLEIGRAHV